MSFEKQSYTLHRYWEQKSGELTTGQKREARAFVFGCFGQKKEFFTGRPIDPKLLHMGIYDLHHLIAKGSPGCNLLPNLKLAYHGPNANAGKAKARSSIQIKDKDRIPPDATTQLRQTVDYSAGSKEMQVNGDAEPDYRAKMWSLLEYGRTTMTKKRAIYGLAELIGVSPQATRDYLEKMVSQDGPLEEFKENGVKRIRVKD
jgi:hypothetical protein